MLCPSECAGGKGPRAFDYRSRSSGNPNSWGEATAPCPRTPSRFGSISGDIPTHSALPERSKVDESVLESSFFRLLLLALISLRGNEISSPSFNLAQAKFHVVLFILGWSPRAGALLPYRNLLPHPTVTTLFLTICPKHKTTWDQGKLHIGWRRWGQRGSEKRLKKRRRESCSC